MVMVRKVNDSESDSGVGMPATVTGNRVQSHHVSLESSLDLVLYKWHTTNIFWTILAHARKLVLSQESFYAKQKLELLQARVMKLAYFPRVCPPSVY